MSEAICFEKNARVAGRPVVTIAVPVYNSERFLEASLDSMLSQSFTGFELIISDNASTDGSGEIARRFARRDPRVLYIRQPRNIGAVANWNYLVHAARGRYFKWSSSNDLLAHTSVEDCVRELEKDPSLVLCSGRTALIDDDGSLIEEYPRDVEFLDDRPGIRFRRACTEMHLNNAQCAVMRLDLLRRTALERIFPEGDMPLMAELALYGRFRKLDKVLLYRRMGRSSATKFMTPEEKAAFRHPEAASRRDPVVAPTALDYLKSVIRAPIPWGDRVLVGAYVARYVLQHRWQLFQEVRAIPSLFRRPCVIKKNKTVALLGAYSSKNFGDTAIQASALHHLRHLLTDVNFVGISHDAVDTLSTHGISGWTLQGDPGRPLNHKSESGATRWQLLRNRMRLWIKVWRLSREIDGMVISGSGQLEDYWGGPWGHSFTLFAWTTAFWLRRKPVAVLATGLDDLSTPLGRRFIRCVLGMARYRSFRDSGTLDGLRKIGFSGSASICPDLAFSYPLAEPEPLRRQSSSPGIVVCPISQRAFRREQPGVYDRYLAELADACVRLAVVGHTIYLSNSQLDMDMPLLEGFHHSLSARIPPDRLVLVPARTLSDFLSLVGQADLVIASRLHALILSTVSITPVVGIAYSRKVSQLMADIGANDFCLSLRDVSSESIATLAERSLSATSERRRNIEKVVSGFSQALRSEYSNVTGVLSGGKCTPDALKEAS